MLTGTQGDYRWIETEHDLGEFLLLCPEVMENRYPVITSVDSGPFRPSPADRVRGCRFINFLGFAFSHAPMKPAADLFWKQMAWMRPESYLGDGDGQSLFATRNAILFQRVLDAMGD